MITTWFGEFASWLTGAILTLGYPGIAILMALESSFFPFPSELVLPPAGYLAAQGRMNAYLALTAGVLGSLGGAAFNYFVAVRLGRPLLHRYSRYLLIREASLTKAEEFFRRHGEMSTFAGRLIPVVRQYISLPAGIAKMNAGRFAIYTAAGAGIWCAVLTYIGWYLGKNAEVLQQADVQRYVGTALLMILPLLAVAIGIYTYQQKRRNRAGQGGPTTTVPRD